MCGRITETFKYDSFFITEGKHLPVFISLFPRLSCSFACLSRITFCFPAALLFALVAQRCKLSPSRHFCSITKNVKPSFSEFQCSASLQPPWSQASHIANQVPRPAFLWFSFTEGVYFEIWGKRLTRLIIKDLVIISSGLLLLSENILYLPYLPPSTTTTNSLCLLFVFSSFFWIWLQIDKPESMKIQEATCTRVQVYESVREGCGGRTCLSTSPFPDGAQQKESTSWHALFVSLLIIARLWALLGIWASFQGQNTRKYTHNVMQKVWLISKLDTGENEK